jgi:hypothetical protein
MMDDKARQERHSTPCTNYVAQAVAISPYFVYKRSQGRERDMQKEPESSASSLSSTLPALESSSNLSSVGGEVSESACMPPL